MTPILAAQADREEPDWLMKSANMPTFSYREPRYVKGGVLSTRKVLNQMIENHFVPQDNGGMKLNIGQHLARRGMTQTALADAVGIKKGFMSEIISGKKVPSLETLRKIVEVLGVEPGEVFDAGATMWQSQSEERKTQFAGAPPPRPQPGFSEGDAAPFSFREDGPSTPFGHKKRFDDLCGILAPGVRSTSFMRMNRAMPGLGLRSGEILILDMNPAPALGNLVVVQFYDDSLPSGAVTLVRVFQPPFLTSPDLTAPNAIISLDSNSTAIMGVIVATIHAPLLTP